MTFWTDPHIFMMAPALWGPSFSFTLVCCVSAWGLAWALALAWESVLGFHAHLRENVMISNLCCMYMRTISRTYQIMGVLWPKLTEQGDFMC